MGFIAAALNFELSRRRTLSIACLIGALLSKETALFALPALVSLRYLATGNRRELGLAARSPGEGRPLTEYPLS